MAFLTILSAIFMLLIFLTGIYGMNVDVMLELQIAWSYSVILVVMPLIA
jgi:magnesium transporter